MPEFRNGEYIKNSASVPLRAVLRSHSSTDARTTIGRPFRVSVCGPSVFALSISSENRALALATDQLSFVSVLIAVLLT